MSSNNSWWADPVVFCRYPEDALALFAPALPRIGGGDMTTICQPLDFLGLNVYYGEICCAGADGLPKRMPFQPGHEVSSFGWSVVPASLYRNVPRKPRFVSGDESA